LAALGSLIIPTRGEIAIFGEVRRYGGCSLPPRRLCHGFCARCGRKFTGFGTQCSSCERAAEHDVTLKAKREECKQRLAAMKRA
jgi:hypothetical protein